MLKEAFNKLEQGLAGLNTRWKLPSASEAKVTRWFGMDERGSRKWKDILDRSVLG